MTSVNIITANFLNGGRQSTTRKLYQYDYGQKISIRGINLPSTFDVHISNNDDANTAETYIGNKNEIEIPDKFLLSGDNIYVWIFLHNTENDGETRYKITIPIQERPRPQAAVPTVDENTINQLLISALQNPPQAKNSKGINVITADFKNERNSITRKIYQYDYGQIITIKNLILPKVFEVHISNSNKANTAQIYIGNNNEIEIPDKFLLSGEDVYLWIFLHSTATDGETRYTITVPVQKKPKPEGQEPTVVEKNTIDQLIAALETNLNQIQEAIEDAKNEMQQATTSAKQEMQLAIDKANDTVLKYPKIIQNYWYIYDVQNQVWVNTNIKALAVDGVGIENIIYNDDYTITINLTNGNSYTTNSIRGQKGDTGLQGEQGPKGDKGDTGPQGPKGDTGPKGDKGDTGEAGPKGDKGDTGSQGPKGDKGDTGSQGPKGDKGDTGSTGAQGPQGIQGEKGDTGATGPAGADGTDGQDGTDGKSAYEYAVDGGYTGTEQQFAEKLAEEYVTDVQVNGTSVLGAGGVANVPIAGTNRLGVVYVAGSGLAVNPNTGQIQVQRCTDTELKAGSNDNKPVVPINQHQATFYGLAKAAGDATQSASSNAVGTYTDTAKAAIKSMLGVEDPEVEDVQINGTSILEAGVANIPIASASSPGVVKVDSANGIGFDSNNKLLLRRSSIDNCRLGSGNMMAVTPWSQHYAAFYGLAKAAGVDLASTSSAQFGTYTDEAKIAIQKMLGVYREWELIADVTVAEDTIQLNILTDLNGQSFALSNMLVRAWLEPATTGNNSYVGSGILVVNTDNVDTTVGGMTKRYMANGAKTYFEYVTDLMCGVCITSGRSASGTASTSSVESISSESDNIKYIRGFRLHRYSDTTSLIPAGSNIKIYGIRI